jgi:spore maturation protein CgeB
MRFALFYQSVISDWNHGNAHFLRGLARALQARGHDVVCYERYDNWSLTNLLRDRPEAIDRFRERFPDLRYERYRAGPELRELLRDRLSRTDVAIVHEWNDPEIVELVGELAAQLGVRALFHDTHYRVVLDGNYRARLGLRRYEGVLAFSGSVAERYAALGMRGVHVLHEAADVTVFSPLEMPEVDDVVLVGNYADGDRSAELEDFVFGPRRALPHLRYAMYGVRYPVELVERLQNGLAIDYRGWIANADVPRAYGRAKVVLHVPRRQYVDLLPGTPTIRVFEALATASCLVSLPWPDPEGLFRAGRDYAVARNPAEMRDLLAWLCSDPAARRALGANGCDTVLARHTCGHRADELLALLR